MEGFGRGSSIQQVTDVKQFGNSSKGDTVFDASQYAFFGNDVVEEVELGGLEDEVEDLQALGIDEEEFLFDKEEGEVFRSLSDVDDLASTFSKLNRDVDGSRNAGFIADQGSRQYSFGADWAQGEDYPTQYGQQVLDSEGIPDGNRWMSQHFSSAHTGETKNLYRATSYPEPQQHHQYFSSDPRLIPKSSFVTHPSPGVARSPNQHLGSPNFPYHSGGLMGSSPNTSPFTNLPPQLAGTHHGSPRFSVEMPHISPGLAMNNRPPAQWMNRPNIYPLDNSGVMNSLLSQQRFPQRNGPVPSQLISRMQVPQNRLPHPMQPSFGNLTRGMQSQLLDSHLSPSTSLDKYDPILGMGDISESRARLAHFNRQNQHLYQPGFDQRRNSGWPQFWSKCMTTNELEIILRAHLAATHSNDPYVDDYYHQACLAKKSNGAKLKHHFCPFHLRNLPPRARANDEPHAFLKVDALGRVPFSSIRRPRPLLEVEPPNSTISGNLEKKDSFKPLEQEPLLAARVTIEDGLCLLLDVDDIDRFLEFNQFQDGGNQLREKRQALLEGLAASLQLVDPFSNSSRLNSGLASPDDFVFLKIVSLPKGRKLFIRYLQLVFPGSELMRIACMTVFRHLRSLFGVLQSDPGAAETMSKLAKTVAYCVRSMDLGSTSACLVAVCCSSEQPPLRPLGSPAGDGASLVLKSVLDRASELLHDTNHSNANMALWRASFDEFFNLLVKYCVSKYDSIMQALSSQVPRNMAGELSDAAAQAIVREMPMELLRSCFPHINEQQKRILMEFLKRSMLGSNNKQME